jgi:hypothetical protein
MKAYLKGSDSPTIPNSLAHKKDFFRHGHADRPGTHHGGSRLFMLNVHMWQYGRPQPRTISVRERHARLVKSKKILKFGKFRNFVPKFRSQMG